MLKNYIKITWRNIRNNKIYSFINIMGLAVGMACCILILLWVQDELNFDKFHENYSDIYRTIPELQGIKYFSNPLALAAVFKEQYPEVRQIARFCNRYWLMKYGDKIYNQSGALVDDDFLKIFTFPLIQGTPETVLASPGFYRFNRTCRRQIFWQSRPDWQIFTDKQRHRVDRDRCVERCPQELTPAV